MAYFKEDNSIVTIEDSLVIDFSHSNKAIEKEGEKIEEAASTNYINSINKGVNYHSQPQLQSQMIIIATSQQNDYFSVASLITIELLLSRQSKIDSRIDKVDTTIAQILQVL